MPGPLEGVRIIDVSEVISGPLAVMILAEQGADVIKVEPPRYGEESRQLANYRDGMAALYANCNHGKRSIGIDLKTEDGLELLYELVRGADVFVQNWRPGAAERLRVAEEDLRRVNSDIVYASITGFGQTGPRADQPGYDYLAQALSGMMSITGRADGEPGAGPLRSGVAVADQAAGMYATVGILAALFHRERTGEGQYLG